MYCNLGDVIKQPDLCKENGAVWGETAETV